MHKLDVIELIIAIVSSIVGAAIGIATFRAKVRRENSEAIAKMIEAKTSLMEFTEKMDVRMASYVEQLQMTRQKMLEMEERHVEEIRSHRSNAEEAILEFQRLAAEWEQHKKECPIFLRDINNTP